jgi:NADH dehydrogenase
MKIVIVGGGFGGLKLARKLNNKKGIEVVLVDKVNYHQFQPLFYQVATAGLDASNISFPLRKVFHKSKNVRVRLAALQQIVAAENKIITDTEEITYDKLVLATGADTNFFGNQQLADHAFPMKSSVEAIKLRHKLLSNFEEATVSSGEDLQRKMNIVVVGGGPTGVEVSGSLAEMKKYILPKDFPELDFSTMNIYLLEGSPKTLAAMSEKSAKESQNYLTNMGVTVMTNTLVVRGNRITTDRHCKVAGSDNIYAIGDLAYMETPKFPKGHPQVAPVAMQNAGFLATNFIQESKGNTALAEFEYFDKGSMATVGRNKAVVDVPKPKLHFKGWFAWLIWMSLHLMMILGVKNRFFVFNHWLYKYFTYDQNLRLIFRSFDKEK